MSRFKSTPKAVSASTLAAPVAAIARPGWVAPVPVTAEVTPKPRVVPAAGSGNMVASFGFFLYCAYLLSGSANDWAMRLIGNQVYISTVTLVLLPVPWLLSGNVLRGLKLPVGRWWAGFLVFLLLAAPLSVWKGGSATLLFNYIPRSFLTFFYICAFVTSLRQCRVLMYVNVTGAIILLLTCMKFGDTGSPLDDARFRIPESLFFSNANDLALALLLGITSFLFLFYRPGIRARMVGVVGIPLSILYALKTGSRGCLLAGVAMFAMICLFSKRKLMAAIFALPLMGLGLLMLPSSTLHRLLLFGAAPETIQAESASDVEAIDSQLQRQELLKKSLVLTVTHPLLGVGPGQFPVAVAGEAAKTGQHSAWLGTHNSYTQVSSECGIPAFICYCAVLVLSFRSNLRLYRQSRDNPALKDVAGLSFCLLAGILVYAVGTIFFHIAYTGYLPELAGFSLALRLAAEPLVERSAADHLKFG